MTRLLPAAPERPRPSPLTVYRVAAGLSQRELAELAGVAEDTISNAERGRHLPRRLTTRALAEALGCQPGDLFPAPDDGAPADRRAA